MQDKTILNKAILGVDISKRKIDVCLIMDNKIRHKIFDNNDAGYQKLIIWCKHHGADLIHVCMEATGHYMEDLANYMHDLQHEVSIVNPAQIKAFARSELLRGKTDKSDAFSIARFCIAHNPSLWQPKAMEVRILRDMYRCLQSLKEQKQQLLNKLENEKMYVVAKEAIIQIITTINNEISKLEKEMGNHIDNNLELKRQTALLTDIKGIGNITACAILAEMPSICNFENARQYAAFAGLTPSYHQSGSSVNRRSRICKIGSERVRKALYMPVLVVKKHNEHFIDFCDRLAARGKAPKLIVVALMRKILHIFFGILKHNKLFNPSLI